jgi:hypothetical protein
MEGDAKGSHRESVMAEYPYRVIAIILGIIGFFLGTRPETYPIPNLSASQVGLLGLGLLVVAVLLFFKKRAFEL